MQILTAVFGGKTRKYVVGWNKSLYWTRGGPNSYRIREGDLEKVKRKGLDATLSNRQEKRSSINPVRTGSCQRRQKQGGQETAAAIHHWSNPEHTGGSRGKKKDHQGKRADWKKGGLQPCKRFFGRGNHQPTPRPGTRGGKDRKKRKKWMKEGGKYWGKKICIQKNRVLCNAAHSRSSGNGRCRGETLRDKKE